MHQNKSAWEAGSLSYTIYHNIKSGILLRVLQKTFETHAGKYQANLKWFVNDTWYLLAVCKLQGTWLPQHTLQILRMPTGVMAHSKGGCNAHMSCSLLALTPRLHRPTGAHWGFLPAQHLGFLLAKPGSPRTLSRPSSPAALIQTLYLKNTSFYLSSIWKGCLRNNQKW